MLPHHPHLEQHNDASAQTPLPVVPPPQVPTTLEATLRDLTMARVGRLVGRTGGGGIEGRNVGRVTVSRGVG